MKPTTIKTNIAKVLKEKGGENVRTMDITKKTTVTDFFVIATGKNPAHVAALANDVMEKMEAKKIYPSRQEGISEGKWAILDFDAVIVHIFNAETRDFYCLETLWKKQIHMDKAVLEEL